MVLLLHPVKVAVDAFACCGEMVNVLFGRFLLGVATGDRTVEFPVVTLTTKLAAYDFGTRSRHGVMLLIDLLVPGNDEGVRT